MDFKMVVYSSGDKFNNMVGVGLLLQQITANNLLILQSFSIQNW